jgi:hypothetical protein
MSVFIFDRSCQKWRQLSKCCASIGLHILSSLAFEMELNIWTTGLFSVLLYRLWHRPRTLEAEPMASTWSLKSIQVDEKSQKCVSPYIPERISGSTFIIYSEMLIFEIDEISYLQDSSLLRVFTIIISWVICSSPSDRYDKRNTILLI